MRARSVDADAMLGLTARGVFWGGYSGYIADPEGQPWEIAWNPLFPLNDDGSVTLPA